jgi:hypothetical protein
MTTTPPLCRRAVSLWIMGLIPALSGVIPVLDEFPEDFRVGVEDPSSPRGQGHPHDHSICIQHEANLWAVDAAFPVAPTVGTLLQGDLAPSVSLPPRAHEARSPLPRSPPIA